MDLILHLHMQFCFSRVLSILKGFDQVLEVPSYGPSWQLYPLKIVHYWFICHTLNVCLFVSSLLSMGSTLANQREAMLPCSEVMWFANQYVLH